MLHNVAVVVLNEFHPFEFGLVCEVFGIDRREDGLPAYDFAVVAGEPGPVRSNNGFTVVPEHGLERLTQADLIAVPAISDARLLPLAADADPGDADPGGPDPGGPDPGGPAAAGARLREPLPEPFLAALRAAVGRGARVLGVCSGAFILGEAGLLDGRRCTTHWRHVDRLASSYPDAKVDPDVLYVDEDPVFTSAGTAAGIDACLYIVRKEQGSRVANGIARRMVVPPHRDGGQAQFVEQPVPVQPAGALGGLLEWLSGNLAESLPVRELAARAHMSERTFARRFTQETGTTPQRWLTGQRILLARQLLEETGETVDAIAAMTGFGNAMALRHHFRACLGVAPTAYRHAFRFRGVA